MSELIGTSITALQVADWRRRVFQLYGEVRRVSAIDAPAAHRLWRAERDALFRTHPSSPLLPGDRAAFTGLPVAEYDPHWRFEVEVRLAGEPLQITVQTGTDGVVPFDLIGSVDIPDAGPLDLWRLASYAGGLFLPLKDASAGKPGGTYGGGRYVLDTVKGADLGPGRRGNTLVIDFNFAYNPSCAYDPVWACPLPQAGNTLPVAIPVGELTGVY